MILLEYFVAVAYVLAMTVFYWLKYRKKKENEDPFAGMQPGKGTDAMAFQATCVCGRKFYLGGTRSEFNNRFADKGYVRWIISTTGLHYSKTGLEKFVEDNEKVFCDDIKQDLTDAKNCNLCDLSKMGKSNFSCKNRICDKLKTKLESSSKHIKWHEIEWQNVTSPESLLSYLYLPKANKGSYTGPESADISALLSLMDGCLCIGRELQDPNTIQHARESRNEIIHSSDMTVTEQDLSRHMTNFKNLLDSVPQKYDTSKEVEKIKRFLRGINPRIPSWSSVTQHYALEVNIHTTEDKSDVLKTAETKALSDLHQANSTILEDIKREIPSASGEELKKLKEQLKQHEIKEAKLEVKLEFYNVDTTQLIKRKTEASELYDETEKKQNEINEFTKLLEDTIVNETETFTLDCQLSKPNRAVQWMHEGKQVVSDGRIKIVVDIHKHQLIIKDATPGDAGNYRCDCGNVSTDCTLVVKELKFTTELQNHDEKEMSTVTLECRLSIPNKNVQWIKSGQPIIPDDRITIIDDKYTHQLIIRDLKLEDAGNCRCACDNVSTECTLNVEELTPEFTKQLENQTGEETGEITLQCQLSKPNQKVQWMKGDQPVIPNDRITVTADKFTHQLTLIDLRMEDAGNFRCICGNASTDCTLKVEEIALEFPKELTDITEEKTKTITLECQLSTPNKMVHWMKADQPINPDDRITVIADKGTHKLIIRDLKLTDAGHFSCVCVGVRTQCTLTVKELTINFVKPLVDTIAYEDDRLTLSCEINQPEQTVVWSMNDQALCNNDDTLIISGIYTHQLVLSSLNSNQAGKYTCACGNASTTANLILKDILLDGKGKRALYLMYIADAEEIRENVLQNRNSLQRLTISNTDLSSLGDKLSDVFTLKQLEQLKLENITLSHEQCQILGPDLRQSPQLRELSLFSITCTTHGVWNGCGDLDLDGPLRLHDITLSDVPFTQVSFNPELLLRCLIDLGNNSVGQISTLHNLIAARKLQILRCRYASEVDVLAKLLNVIPHLHCLRHLEVCDLRAGWWGTEWRVYSLHTPFFNDLDVYSRLGQKTLDESDSNIDSDVSDSD